jgi:hypothetical protein
MDKKYVGYTVNFSNRLKNCDNILYLYKKIKTNNGIMYKILLKQDYYDR